MGHLGGSVVEQLPSAQVVIPGSWDRVPHQVPCREPASPSANVSVSLLSCGLVVPEGSVLGVVLGSGLTCGSISEYVRGQGLQSVPLRTLDGSASPSGKHRDDKG